MKRSEMIKYIIKPALENRFHFCTEDDCNDILEAIEEAGMLPPDIPRSNYNGDNSPTINEWEPEDE